MKGRGEYRKDGGRDREGWGSSSDVRSLPSKEGL